MLSQLSSRLSAACSSLVRVRESGRIPSTLSQRTLPFNSQPFNSEPQTQKRFVSLTEAINIPCPFH